MMKLSTQKFKGELSKWCWDILKLEEQNSSESEAIQSQKSVNNAHFGGPHFLMIKQSKGSKSNAKHHRVYQGPTFEILEQINGVKTRAMTKTVEG